VYPKGRGLFDHKGKSGGGGVLTKREEELVWIHKETLGGRRRATKRGEICLTSYLSITALRRILLHGVKSF